MLKHIAICVVLSMLFITSFVVCEECNGNATREDGSCYNTTCLPGWSGEECNIAQCKERCHKTNGYCTQPGECKCALGWRGENCDECVALPGCKNGYCNTSSYECICKNGWKGTYCSIPKCREDCHPSRGYCKVPGECRCRIGWGGSTCDVCRSLPGCKNGYCTKPLECKCHEGWTGLLCDQPICKDNCSKEHGSCSKPGECRCNVGWWGDNCKTCFPYPGCKHGHCEKPWECICKPGYKGMTCDEEIQPEMSYCHTHPNPCNNGGTCVDYGERKYICACSTFFTGEHCDFYTESRPYYFPILPRGSSRTIATPLTSVNKPTFEEHFELNTEEVELTTTEIPTTQRENLTFRVTRTSRMSNSNKTTPQTTPQPQIKQKTMPSQLVTKKIKEPLIKVPVRPDTKEKTRVYSKSPSKVTIRKKISPVLLFEFRNPNKPFPENTDIKDTDANSPQANQINARFLRHHDSGSPINTGRSISSYKVPSFIQHEREEIPRPSRLRTSPQIVHGPSPVFWEPVPQGSNVESVIPARLTGSSRQYNVGQKRSIFISRNRPVPNQSLRGFSSRENYETVQASESSSPRNVRESAISNLYHIQNYNGRVHIGDTTEVDKNAPLAEILEAFIELKKLKR